MPGLTRIIGEAIILTMKTQPNRTKLRRVTLHLSDWERERLVEWAAETGLTKAEIVRRALDAYLERRDAYPERQPITPPSPPPILRKLPRLPVRGSLVAGQKPDESGGDQED